VRLCDPFRRLSAACALLVPILPGVAAGDPATPSAATEVAADGTHAETWTLANGLRVVTLDVPGADAVAIALEYVAGRDDDPQGQEGLTELMAEAAFTAATGNVPARTRAELDSRRPIGWNIQVERTRTELAELATPDQFPGVLHEVALRMSGVKLTDGDVERAQRTLVHRHRTVFAEDPATRLYAELGQMAAGWNEAAFSRWLSGEGLQKLRARDIAPLLQSQYVPARAVLSLAGDFSGVNLRAFVENEFGSIPPGTSAPAREDRAPAERKTIVRIPGLTRTIGGIGVIAPALTDSLHPSFLLTMFAIGTSAGGAWGQADPPVRSRFQYSILDDPELARFYPPVRTGSWTPDNLAIQLGLISDGFKQIAIGLDQARQMANAVAWLLGGPLSPQLASRIQTDHAVLYRVCSAGAVRELWGGEPFWSLYRSRFEPGREDPLTDNWLEWMNDPQHQVAIVYLPAP